MAVISTLATSVVARTRGFSKGLGKAQNSLRRFAGSVGGVARRFAGLGAAITGVAGVAGLAALTKQSFSLIDATAKTADKLGLTTEALTGMRHAAELTGVTTRQLDLGIQRMTRRIAEAAQGTGEAQGALKNLGLEAKALAQLSPDRQFAKIADAMAGIDNQGERVRLGFKLFDAEGVSLINTLAGGSKGLQQMMKEARDLGATFSRIDAAKIEQANDAFTRVRLAIRGLGNQLAIRLAPIIESVTRKFVDWAKEGQGVGGKVQHALAAVGRTIGRVADGVELVKAGFFGLIGAGQKLGQALTSIFQKITEAMVEMQNTVLSGAQSIATQAAQILGPGAVAGALGARGINFIRTRKIATDFWANIASGFGDAAEDSFSKASNAFDAFANQANTKRIAEFYDSLVDKSEAFARNTLDQKRNFLSLAQTAEKATRTPSADFQEFDLRNINVAGLSLGQRNKIQRTEDQGTHTRLDQLRQLLAAKFASPAVFG